MYVTIKCFYVQNLDRMKWLSLSSDTLAWWGCSNKKGRNPCTHHYPVLRVHKVNRPSCLPLHSFMHNTASHAVDEKYPHKTAFLMGVCAFSYHCKQVGVQVLEGKKYIQQYDTWELICFLYTDTHTIARTWGPKGSFKTIVCFSKSFLSTIKHEKDLFKNLILSMCSGSLIHDLPVISELFVNE